MRNTFVANLAAVQVDHPVQAIHQRSAPITASIVTWAAVRRHFSIIHLSTFFFQIVPTTTGSNNGGVEVE
jgi:hypothetical protein